MPSGHLQSTCTGPCEVCDREDGHCRPCNGPGETCIRGKCDRCDPTARFSTRPRVNARARAPAARPAGLGQCSRAAGVRHGEGICIGELEPACFGERVICCRVVQDAASDQENAGLRKCVPRSRRRTVLRWRVPILSASRACGSCGNNCLQFGTDTLCCQGDVIRAGSTSRTTTEMRPRCGNECAGGENAWRVSVSVGLAGSDRLRQHTQVHILTPTARDRDATKTPPRRSLHGQLQVSGGRKLPATVSIFGALRREGRHQLPVPYHSTRPKECPEPGT